MKKFVKAVLFLAILLAVLLPAAWELTSLYVKVVMKTPRVFRVLPDLSLGDFERLLAARNSMAETIDYVNKTTPEGSKVLLYRRGKFESYCSVPTVMQFHPMLEKVYASRSKEEACRELYDLGISRILVPQYYIPLLSGGVVGELIADPRFTQRDFYCAGNSVYRVLPPAESRPGQKGVTTPLAGMDSGAGASLKMPWTRMTRRGFYAVPPGKAAELVAEDETEHPAVFTGSGPLGLRPVPCQGMLKVKPATRYTVRGKLKGKGRVSVFVVSYLANGLAKMNTLVWDGCLVGGPGSKEFAGQYTTTHEETCLRLLFVMQTTGKIEIREVSFTDYGPAGNGWVVEDVSAGGLPLEQRIKWRRSPSGTRINNEAWLKKYWGYFTTRTDQDRLSGQEYGRDHSIADEAATKRVRVRLDGRGLIAIELSSKHNDRQCCNRFQAKRYFFVTGHCGEVVVNLPESVDLRALDVSIRAIGLQLWKVDLFGVDQTSIMVHGIDFQRRAAGQGGDWQSLLSEDVQKVVVPQD